MRHVSTIRFVSFLKTKSLFIFHYVLFLIGFVFGSLSVMLSYSFTDSTYFVKLLISYFGQSYISCFLNHLIYNLILLTVIYLASFYTFGAPLSLLVFSLYSLGAGSLMTAVCKHIGTEGVLINVTTFLLPFLAFALVLCFMSCAAISYSYTLSQNVFGKRAIADVGRKTKDTFILYLILSACVLVISLISSLLTLLITGIITL